jgi:hypothetical protein
MWIWVFRAAGVLGSFLLVGKSAKDLGDGLEKTFKYFILPAAAIYALMLLQKKQK